MNKLNGKTAPYKQPKPFIAHTRIMRNSLAFQRLSGSALRVLLRLELEYLNHGGPKINGKIICTFADFRACGIGRDAIITALDELETLGFIIIRRGREGSPGYRRPHTYRLTYLPSRNGNKIIAPTDEWAEWTKKHAQNSTKIANLVVPKQDHATWSRNRTTAHAKM